VLESTLYMHHPLFQVSGDLLAGKLVVASQGWTCDRRQEWQRKINKIQLDEKTGVVEYQIHLLVVGRRSYLQRSGSKQKFLCNP
jgi:hypothetical protein